MPFFQWEALEIDENSAVLGVVFQSVASLYAAGEVAGGDKNEFPHQDFSDVNISTITIEDSGIGTTMKEFVNLAFSMPTCSS